MYWLNTGIFEPFWTGATLPPGIVRRILPRYGWCYPDAKARQLAMAAYGPVSNSTVLRARGWALLFACFLLDTGLTDHPVHAGIGRRILAGLDQRAA